MITIKGQGVCGGIAFGKAELLIKRTKKVERIKISDTKAEINRFNEACKKAERQLE